MGSAQRDCNVTAINNRVPAHVSLTLELRGAIRVLNLLGSWYINVEGGRVNPAHRYLS